MNRFVLKHKDVCSFTCLAHFVNMLRDRLTVKLVVAGHIKNWFAGEDSRSPFNALDTHVNVTSQDDHVGIRLRWFELVEFDMQIAEDVETHEWWMGAWSGSFRVFVLIGSIPEKLSRAF